MAIDKDVLDQLLAGRDPCELFAKDGLLDELKKALSERMLAAELDDRLEAENAEGAINRRNGSSRKTMLTGTSKVTLDVPRDRAGTFDPKLIAKYQRRFPDFDDKIISMYARGMTVREIRGHIEELYGIEVSPTGRGAHSMPAIRWSSSTRSASKSAMKVSFGTRRCTSRWASCPMAPRIYWASGSSKPRAPSSGFG